MRAVIFKNSENDFDIIDPYKGGVWNFDKVELLEYLSIIDFMQENNMNLNNLTSDLLGLIDEEVFSFMKEEGMPINTTYFPNIIRDRLDKFEKGIIVPPEILLEVNRICNCNCPWCYIPSMSQQNDTLTLDEIRKNIIIPFIQEGARSWTITGGEPSLTFERTLQVISDIKEITKKNWGRKPIINLLTNGYNFKEYASAYKMAGLTTVQFQLSSPIEKEELALRKPFGGVNSYEHVIEGIKEAKRLGINTLINMVVTSNNMNSIEQMAKLADSLNVDTLRITPAVISGMARKNGIFVDTQMYESIKTFAINARSRLLSNSSNLNLYLPSFDIEKDRPMRCSLGYTDFYVNYSGNVYPCNNLIDDSLVCDPGNIKEFKGPDIWYGSKLLGTFRDYKTSNIGKACGSCKQRGMCVGNCIAQCWQRYRKFDLLDKPSSCFKDWRAVNH